MPKLGEFIGALLSDAVQARVRADLEAVKIAEVYSGHELLKHLSVPRFRLPDITVDVPVLVSSVEGPADAAGGRSFGQPTRGELTKVVRAGLKRSGLRIARADSDKVAAAVVDRAEELFESGPQTLLSPTTVSRELATTAVDAVRTALRRDAPAERIQALQSATRTSLAALLSTKLVESPHLQVLVTSGEIKAHGDNESVVRMRLTITEDAVEVIDRDDGQGFFLTPE
jgi:hypothetical protein